MAYNQLRTPNLGILDIPGWCLRLVLRSFDFSSGAEFARQEWDRNTTKRTDALPTDVAVPVFYSWVGTIDGIKRDWGDVAIHVPGRGVFGTPMRPSGKSNRWDPSVEARRIAIGGNAQYLGWTESLNGIKLIEKAQEEEMITKDDVGLLRIAHTEIGGWPFDEVHSGKWDQRFLDVYLGTPVKALIWRQWNEHDDWRKARQAAFVAMSEIAKRPTQQNFDNLKTALNACQVEEGKAVDELAKLKAQNTADQAAGDSFLRRIGQFLKRYLP